MDTEKLRGGEEWESVIRQAVRDSSHFVACMSTRSINKRGFVQKELREALEVVDEMPPGRIYIVPVRLEEVQPNHERLTRLHWIDLFPNYQSGFRKLAISLGLSPTETRDPSSVQEPISAGNHYPRVFVSYTTAYDRRKLDTLMTALLDTTFNPLPARSSSRKHLPRLRFRTTSAILHSTPYASA